MIIDTNSINVIKSFLCFPQKYGLTYMPIWKCFNITNVVTSQDKLYEHYVEYINKPLPKTIFYIILKMMYNHYSGIDKNSGNFGYRLSCNFPSITVLRDLHKYNRRFSIEINKQINKI